MVTLTLQCSSLSQLREEMASFLNGSLPPPICGPALAPPIEGPQVMRTEVAEKLTSNQVDVLTVTRAPLPEDKKPRRGRKPKAAPQAGFEAPTSPNPEEPFEVKKHHQEPSDEDQAQTTATAEDLCAQVVAAPVANKEAVHQALQQVNIAVGLPKAREILQSFSVNRISEIKEDQYKPFIEKCNEAVMLEG